MTACGEGTSQAASVAICAARRIVKMEGGRRGSKILPRSPHGDSRAYSPNKNFSNDRRTICDGRYVTKRLLNR